MILTIIPARSGSKGILNKNIFPICGKPLIEYTIDAVENSRIDHRYIISTDSYLNYNNSIVRPSHLATDDAKAIDVMKHALDKYDSIFIDSVCYLQPTSPLRTAEDINSAIREFQITGASSLYSGYYMGIKHKDKTYDKHQQKPHFQRNGAIFLARKELIRQGKIWDENVIEFEMPKERSIDIDDMSDMFIAESLIKNGVLEKE
jgi:CMP-N-acetylneuraminic acid synthetase